MKEIDRKGFRIIIAEQRAKGLSLMAAVEKAYIWLLKPRNKAHPVSITEIK